MKKALKLVLMYFLTLILATAAGVIFYSVYLGIQKYVVGGDLVFFTKEGFLRALFYVISCVTILICPAMLYVRISNKGGIAHFITFILLSAVTWGVLIPVQIKLENKIIYNIKDSSRMLSAGYFRQSDDKIYYFSNFYNANPYVSPTTVVIDTSENGEVEITKTAPSRDFVLFRDSAPYGDVLVKNMFEGSTPSEPIISFSLIMSHAENAMNSGWTFYLAFMSMGLLLCCLYGSADMFRWKLLNTCFMMTAAFFVLAANTLYFHPVVTSFCRQYINNRPFIVFLSKYMDYPLLVISNVFFSLVFIVIGIVRFATRKKRNY